MISAEIEGVQGTLSRWYVTNGVAVVGPVATDLLLRGITNRRIPPDCMVTQENWSSWRALHQIREVSRIARTPAWMEAAPDEIGGVPESFIRGARDAGEALLFAMLAAAKATRATAALAHRMREPFVGLVTSATHGPGVHPQLGQVLGSRDPMLVRAERRNILLGVPDGGEAERATARRFSEVPGELRGVAMIPVFDGDRRIAILELGRVDHPFRIEDMNALQRVANVVCLK